MAAVLVILTAPPLVAVVPVWALGTIPPTLVAISSIPAVTPILASATPVVAVMAIVAVPPLRAVSLRAVAVVLARGASATFALPLTG
jgi:hypothetical protein